MKSTQLQQAGNTLTSILKQHGLYKSAEDVTHKSLLEQKDLGKEQADEIHSYVPGINADTREAVNTDSAKIQEYPNCQSLKATAESALSGSGSSVCNVTGASAPCSDPATLQEKAASADYRQRLAMLIRMNKNASFEREQAANFRTGSYVFDKLASLNPQASDAQFANAHAELQKLASYNPVFAFARNNAIQRKIAEDVAELAKTAGVSFEVALAHMDKCAEENPEMVDELVSEAEGEAVADLANAEEETAAMLPGLQIMADNASEALGRPVSIPEVIDSTDVLVQAADELGIEPLELLQLAVDQGDIESQMSPEDQQEAQQLLDAAAAEGISPDEVIQVLAEEIANEDAGVEGDAPEGPECECGEESCECKQASYPVSNRVRFALQHA